MKKKVLCLAIAIVAILTLGVQTSFATVPVQCSKCYSSAFAWCNLTPAPDWGGEHYVDYDGIEVRCGTLNKGHYITLDCSKCGRDFNWSRHATQIYHFWLGCKWYGSGGPQPGSPCY